MISSIESLQIKGRFTVTNIHLDCLSKLSGILSIRLSYAYTFRIMAPAKGKVAFVTGANGITGNAIIEHLIRKPESEW